jgi:hypothetical protein
MKGKRLRKTGNNAYLHQGSPGPRLPPGNFSIFCLGQNMKSGVDIQEYDLHEEIGIPISG